MAAKQERAGLAAIDARLDREIKDKIARAFLGRLSQQPGAPKVKRWTSKDGKIERIYFPNDAGYLTITRDGATDRERGYETLRDSALYPAQRRAFRAAWPGFREDVRDWLEVFSEKRVAEIGKLALPARNRAGNPARARVRAELLEARDALRTLRDERRAKRPALRADDAAERRRRIDAAIERLRGQLSEIRAEFRRRRAELAAEQRAALLDARARHRVNLAAIRAEIRDRDAQRWARLLELRRVVAEKRALLASMRSESAVRRGRRSAEPLAEAIDYAGQNIAAERPDLVLAWREFLRGRASRSRLLGWYRAGKEKLRKGSPRSFAGETIGVAFIEYADENPDLVQDSYNREQERYARMTEPEPEIDPEDWESLPIRDEAIEGVPF